MDLEDIPPGMLGKPDSLEELVENITVDLYEKLKHAVEIRKWPDGSMLSDEQLEQSLQLVILYEAKRLPDSDRIGAPLQNSCTSNDSEVRPVILDSDLKRGHK